MGEGGGYRRRAGKSYESGNLKYKKGEKSGLWRDTIPLISGSQFLDLGSYLVVATSVAGLLPTRDYPLAAPFFCREIIQSMVFWNDSSPTWIMGSKSMLASLQDAIPLPAWFRWCRRCAPGPPANFSQASGLRGTQAVCNPMHFAPSRPHEAFGTWAEWLRGIISTGL